MQWDFFMGKRRLELMMAVLILAGAFYVGRLGAQMHQMCHQTTAAVSQEAKVRKVVVDAGHGGFVLEKSASMEHWKRILIWK